MMLLDYFNDPPSDPRAYRGWPIYHAALTGRHGFRPDQLGIPEEDDVWLELFDAIGAAAESPGPEKEAGDANT